MILLLPKLWKKELQTFVHVIEWEKILVIYLLEIA